MNEREIHREKRGDGEKASEKCLLVWINFERMQWWWYAKMQFVFSKQNYRSTNKHIGLFLCFVQRMWCIPLVACITQCVRSSIQRRGNLNSSFSKSNKFLWREFSVFVCEKDQSKNVLQRKEELSEAQERERERKELYTIVKEIWQILMRYYLHSRSPFSGMAESEVCIAAWLKVLLEVQQTHYDVFFFAPYAAAASFTSFSDGFWKIPFECDSSRRCNFSNSHRNSSNNKLFYVKMIYLRK